MSITPSKISFADIVKHPLVYALIIIGSLLGVFITTTITQGSDSVKRCETEKESWRALYINERAKNDAINRELLIRNGVISVVPEVLPEIVDSINKTK